MRRLIEGVHRFQAGELGRYRELFGRLAREGQQPHTLFITCSDSRVLAELITQSQPGDLFVVKNPGNIVPPASVTGSTNSTAASIEFAVEVLGVSDIVVCGHSQCGAIKALMGDLPPNTELPHLERWLNLMAPVRERVRNRCAPATSQTDQRRAAEQENVLFALENLRSYPAVRRRLGEGSLRLHGWFFEIATGELFAYDSLGGLVPLRQPV